MLALVLALASPATAQDDTPVAPAPAAPAPAADEPAADQPPASTEPPAPIYDEKLLRLSEILGALSFLRDLCGQSDGPAWRDEMSALLTAEKPAPQRRA